MEHESIARFTKVMKMYVVTSSESVLDLGVYNMMVRGILCHNGNENVSTQPRGHITFASAPDIVSLSFSVDSCIML